MRRIIHHLRGLSDKQKRDVLHFSTLIFAILLVLIWVYTLGHSFSDVDTKIKIQDSLEPFNNLKDNIVNEYNNL
jgi:hypothetical protein